MEAEVLASIAKGMTRLALEESYVQSGLAIRKLLERRTVAPPADTAVRQEEKMLTRNPAPDAAPPSAPSPYETFTIAHASTAISANSDARTAPSQEGVGQGEHGHPADTAVRDERALDDPDTRQALGVILEDGPSRQTAEEVAVRRFSCFETEDGVYEHAEGSHVAYKDYAALQAEVIRLRKSMPLYDQWVAVGGKP